MCRPAGIRRRTTANAAMACQYRRSFASSQVAKKLTASKTAARTAAPLSGVRCRVKNGPSLTCHRVPPATWWTCSRGSVVPGRCVSGRSRTGPAMRPDMSARYCADGRRPAPTPPPGSHKCSARTIGRSGGHAGGQKTCGNGNAPSHEAGGQPADRTTDRVLPVRGRSRSFALNCGSSFPRGMAGESTWPTSETSSRLSEITGRHDWLRAGALVTHGSG